MLCVTKFHPVAYFKATTGVSSYQPWYAVHDPTGYAYYIWDLLIKEPFVVVSLLMLCFYLYKLLTGTIDIRSVMRYGAPAIILATGYFAIHLYKLSDGGGTEYFIAIFFSICLAEVINFLSTLIKRNGVNYSTKAVTISAGFFAAVLVVQMSQSFTDIINGTYSNGTYVEELGGNLTSFGESIIDTKEKLDGLTVFSTYASAVETVIEQFQPSGVDYIIHALGDDNRESYLTSFEDSTSDFVAVIKEDYASWEGYIRSENWFFYREFLNSYDISFSNDYQYYYKKVFDEQEENLPCNISVLPNSDGTYTISVDYGSSAYNGLADIKLSYSVKKTECQRNMFCFKTLLYVHDVHNGEGIQGYKDFSLPGGNDNSFYIPIKITNGVGSAILTSYPLNYSYIDNITAENMGFFKNALDIATVTDVNSTETGILLYYTTSSNVDVLTVNKIQHEGNIFNILESGEDENGKWLRVDATDGNFEILDAVKLLTN